MVYLFLRNLALYFLTKKFNHACSYKFEKNAISLSRFKFFYQLISLGTVVAKILTTVPSATYSSFTNDFKFPYILAKFIMFRPVVIYKLKLRQVSNNNATRSGSQRSFSKCCVWDELGNFHQNHPLLHWHYIKVDILHLLLVI